MIKTPAHVPKAVMKMEFLSAVKNVDLSSIYFHPAKLKFTGQIQTFPAATAVRPLMDRAKIFIMGNRQIRANVMDTIYTTALNIFSSHVVFTIPTPYHMVLFVVALEIQFDKTTSIKPITELNKPIAVP